MNQHLKQRLVGATVLILLGIIFLPMIMERPVDEEIKPDVTNIQLDPYPEKKPVKVKKTTRTIPPEVIARYEDSKTGQKQLETQKANRSTNKNQNKQIAKIQPEQSATPEKKPEKPSANKTTNRQWAIQMASFSSKDNAIRLVQRLKLQMYPAFYEDVSGNGKTIYRVRVGPYESRSKTEKIKQKLDQHEKLQTLIVVLQ